MAFDIKKLTGREKNLVGILVLIFSTLPFFYLTVPSWNEYLESRTKISQNKTKEKELEAHAKMLEKFKRENLELTKKLSLQKQYLAKSYEIDFLVEDLKKICDDSSISLESFTPTNPEPINIILEKQLEKETQGTYSLGKLKQVLEKLKGQDMPVDLYRFPIEVKISGNFTDVLELFKKLEKYGRVISIENISLGKLQAKQSFGDRLSKSKQKKEADTGTVNGSFDLIAYSSAKENEKLPFSAIEERKTTFKFKKKARR